MNWLLLYLAVTTGVTGVQTGLMTTGPFETATACLLYAEEFWTESSWKLQVMKLNFYDSKSVIYLREHVNGDMSVFYSCVKVREPEKK